MSENKDRMIVLLGLFGMVFLVFIGRLFYLQVISTDFAASADRNVIKRVVLEPTRGVIYDRRGRIYVTNTPIFDLNITPKDFYLPDTAVFARFLKVDNNTIRQRILNIRSAKDYNPNKPTPFEKQINADVYAGLQESLWETRGITTIPRNTRNYLYPVGANFLGYISEVGKKDIDKSEGYYSQGDLQGTTGLEHRYESLLRGKKGVKMTMVDVHGREVGAFSEGKYDTLPQKGADLMVSVDAELQLFGEALMENKKGSIVAIEPATGEILAFVSAPTYDPNLLTGMETSLNWRALSADSLLPLFDRPLMAMYPPGSIFKLMNALTGLSVGSLSENTVYGCSQGFSRNNGHPHCHIHPSPLNLFGAIQNSCNAYFAAVYVDMLQSGRFSNFSDAFDTWHEYMSKFGVGHRVGIDIPNEKPGMLPSAEFYDKWYGEGRWKAMTIVSNSIGQGEVTMTPLQMANSLCVIANRGYYIQPHFFRQLVNSPATQIAHFDKIEVDIKPEHFQLVTDAMAEVVNSGTGTMARVKGIQVCGKTGTAQNKGEDHSVFIAFAPKDHPKIAIAVIVENAGWGGTWAAPIASLMIERYLRGSITDPAKLKYILDADFIHSKYVLATTKNARKPSRFGNRDFATEKVPGAMPEMEINSGTQPQVVFVANKPKPVSIEPITPMPAAINAPVVNSPVNTTQSGAGQQ